MKKEKSFRVFQAHRHWVPYFVLIGTLGLTILATAYVKDSAEDKDQIRFQNAIQRTENNIENRLNTYIAMLRGGAGLFSASKSVNRDEFQAYVTRLLLEKNYPGVQGIGFSKEYSASERQQILTDLQIAGMSNVTLSPGFIRPVYYPIVYLEPLDQRNRAAIGYDMFTEPTRRAAMERARDQGIPAASGKVVLVQEIDEQKQAGFLIYVPIYEGGGIPDTLTERRNELEGFIFSPFRADDLMAGIFSVEPYPAVSFQVYDGTTPSPDSLLYSSRLHDGSEQLNYKPRYTATLTTSIAGRPWTVVYATKPVFDATSQLGLVPYVASGGTIISLILFGITRSQVQARTDAERSAAKLRQSEYNLQRSHDELENRVEERTAELLQANTILQAEIAARQQIQEALEQAEQSLKQALSFEAMLRRITDRVHDSLDEKHILQTAVEALATGLDVARCNTGLYDLDQEISTISAEATVHEPSMLGRTVQMVGFSEGYEALLSGQNLQFCIIGSASTPEQVSVLACPIFDNQGILGDLWLFRPPQQVFSAFEVGLVEQVVTQCAIALRQARLYEAAQAQVKALERVNWLKDDFLSTVSHELRTPMSNMNLAIRMLELTFSKLENLNGDRQKAQQYLQILHSECQREINLINDLLDLQRLVSGKQLQNVQSINLRIWLTQLVEPFEERARARQQSLKLQLSPQDLPPLVADIAGLERILSELLNNACKYTPPHETITVHTQSYPGKVEFSVCNSGTEIPEDEQSRIFDKFYRVPNADPWKQGGTGLGLALAQRLAEHMGGQIQVRSAQNITTFTVVVPNQIVRDRIHEPV
ncbi:CHASE domain-containing protein [Oscillatoria sp. FACHB-1407]|uniref:CHASE domain-containing protein n=1 Tax=Oscillatoria sp. FACHB-1407 TaxID=2692847 RepID=UPI00168371A9|nr:CHASE domain-containing protein [Oscillatoria sp. FACHB-1407]MBD2464688.1 CHASE domain-containing protein [Oscillatoria sp. FACHB-1407]